MDAISGLMLAVVLVMLIVMSIGEAGLTYLVELWKSKLTRSRKTKMDHTV